MQQINTNSWVNNLGYYRTWWHVALVNLLVIAFGGLLLRAILVFELEGLNFAYLRHAHSHGALLGWLYSAFFVALLQLFLPGQITRKKTYAWLFWLSQAAVLGMLCSFPVQGYAAVSITFSTLHILFSYGFAFFLFRDLHTTFPAGRETPVSVRFAQASLVLLVLSSLGPWALGLIMASGLSGSDWYFNAIYYYLHFQYNGWFSFAVFALFFRWLELQQIAFPAKSGRMFFWLLAMAVLPAYLLSVLWIKPPGWVYGIAGIAAALQLIGYGFFLTGFNRVLPMLKSKLHPTPRLLFGLALVAFTLKLVLQLFSAFPVIAHIAYRLRHFVIGYLHLVLIGFVSLFLLGFFAQLGWLSTRGRPARAGLLLFLLGFVLSEVLIFGQGTAFWLNAGAIPGFDGWLFAASAAMPLGLLLLLLPQFRKAGIN